VQDARCNGQCGEEWIDSKTAKELEKIVNSARKTHSELEVLSFQS